MSVILGWCTSFMRGATSSRNGASFGRGSFALRSSSCSFPHHMQDWSLTLALAPEVSRELLQRAVVYVPYIRRRAHVPL
jgi:hypothetical protein